MNSETILHMVCQSIEQNRGGGVTVGDVARWMGCAKPTAQKWLDKLVQQHWLVVNVLKWRSNANIRMYYPSGETKVRFAQKYYKPYYDMHIRDLDKQATKARQERMF